MVISLQGTRKKKNKNKQVETNFKGSVSHERCEIHMRG